MDVKLGGLEAYTDDIWDRIPDDVSAFKDHEINPTDESTYDEIGYVCRMAPIPSVPRSSQSKKPLNLENLPPQQG
jgi:hypothetical protein